MLLYMSNSAREGQSTPLHSVSVAGVVVREDGRLLAIRRADNGTWELPGGVLELDETPEAGVAREVLEETGIHVEVDELTGVYKNTTRGIVALVFRCKPSGGTERTSSESTAVSWLTPEEVSERMSEVFAVRLLDALDGNGPHVRSHDGRRLIPAG
ncbi:NUDIX domain-containing protein [Streptomyces collinus]|uniref:NUDIX hydrolase n=1 Tax=Streptomyces collinus TaxID=42684 RepID=UPI0036E1FE39